MGSEPFPLDAKVTISMEPSSIHQGIPPHLPFRNLQKWHFSHRRQYIGNPALPLVQATEFQKGHPGYSRSKLVLQVW